MKIEFHKGDEPQKPIMPAQEEMRRAQIKKAPVFKFLGVIVLAFLVGYGVYWFMTKDVIYTYGIVSGELDTMNAPVDSTVARMHVRQGDIVKKGEVLYVLESKDMRSQLKTANNNLEGFTRELAAAKTGTHPEISRISARINQNQVELDDLNIKLSAVENKAKSGLSDASYKVEYAEIEVKKLADFFAHKKDDYEKLQQLKSADSISSEMAVAEKAVRLAGYNLEQAKIEETKLKDFHMYKQERYEKLEKLFKMDGAVRSDVETAKHEAQIAQRNLERARIDVTKANELYEVDKDFLERLKKVQAAGKVTTKDVSVAENEMQVAQRNFEQAKLDLKYAINDAKQKKQEYEKQLVSLRSALDKATLMGKELQSEKLYVENKLQGEIARIENQIKAAKLEVERYAQFAGPYEYKAGFDGVVLEARVSDGNAISKGALILVLASGKSLWVDAYVPQKKSGVEFEKRMAKVYAEGSDKAIVGEGMTRAGAAVKVPDALKKKMTDIERSIYIRVKVPANSGLLPGSIVRVVIH